MSTAVRPSSIRVYFMELVIDGILDRHQGAIISGRTVSCEIPEAVNRIVNSAVIVRFIFLLRNLLHLNSP